MSLANTKMPVAIEKENIAGLKFPAQEVLGNADLISKRKNDLDQALTLGNREHNKVKIVFEDADGVKQVETTVWGITDKRVILKQDLLIPINRIHQVTI